jgi:hypothetical protein
VQGFCHGVRARRTVRAAESADGARWRGWQESYAPPAFLGGAAYVLARSLGAPLGLRIAAGFFACAIVRTYCWKAGARLPTMGRVWDRSTVPAAAAPGSCVEDTAPAGPGNSLESRAAATAAT